MYVHVHLHTTYIMYNIFSLSGDKNYTQIHLNCVCDIYLHITHHALLYYAYTHPSLYISPLIDTAFWWTVTTQTAITGHGHLILDPRRNSCSLTRSWGNSCWSSHLFLSSCWCSGARVFEHFNICELNWGTTSSSALNVSLQWKSMFK